MTRTTKNLTRSIVSLIAFFAIAVAISYAAEDVVTSDSAVIPAGCNECASCDGGSCCSSDHAVCSPKRVTEEVKKHSWLVKPKLVCVPGFRWPWECGGKSANHDCGDTCSGEGCDRDKGCAPRCGYVRCVNVLEKHNYKCKKCAIEWEVKCVRRGNRCSGGGDRCPRCGDSAN